MKCKLTTIVLFSAFILPSKTQTLDSFLIPAMWDEMVYRDNSGLVPSSVDTFSTNVWDFSAIKASTDSTKYTFKPLSSSLLSEYPLAKFSASTTSANNLYANKNNSLIYFGRKSAFQYSRAYSNGMTLLKFPVTLNSKNSQSTTFVEKLGSQTFNGTGSYNYTVPSKGKLKLGTKTYDNVLLVVGREYYNYDGQQYLNVTYTWYSPGHKWYLAQLSVPHQKSGSTWNQMMPGMSFTQNPLINNNSAGFQETSTAALVKISPNPATNKISVSGITNAVQVKIIDMCGKIMLNKTIQPNESIDISSFRSGVYSVVLAINSQELIAKRLLKM